MQAGRCWIDRFPGQQSIHQHLYDAWIIALVNDLAFETCTYKLGGVIWTVSSVGLMFVVEEVARQMSSHYLSHGQCGTDRQDRGGYLG